MSKPIFTPFNKEDLLPQEEVLEVALRNGKFSIGLPRETHHQENRICLTPDAVEVLVRHGHQITVESCAGKGVHYTDNQYSEAGAKITYDAKEVFQQHIVLKVLPPTIKEIDFLKPETILISSVLPNTLEKDYFEHLAKKKITALGMEYYEDAHGNLAIKRLEAEISGTSSLLIASELLSTSNGGNGILLGGVTGVRPAEVVILGAGTVGEYAAKAGLGLGASVRVFDGSLTRLRTLQDHLNFRVSTSTLDPKEITKALMRCDVAIGAIWGDCRALSIVTEDMVKKMKPGAVIIDVSIDSGGCFETSEVTTHENPVVVKHEVIHYGVANIPSRFARTASKALSNFFLSYLIQVAKEGGFENLIHHDKGLRKGIYLFKGRHTNKELADWFDLNFTDLNLLML